MELQQMFPETPIDQLKAALAEGGDLNEVASRLLAGASAAAAPVGLSMMTQDTAPPSELAGASESSAECHYEGLVNGRFYVRAPEEL